MTQVEIQELPIDAPQEPASQEELAPQEPEPQEEASQEEPTPPKRKRGRPPGSKNVKEPKARPPPKAAPKAKGKAKPAAQEPEPQEESLPQYVQQSLPPRPPDFAAQLFGLLQEHERERVGRRRATYASWLSRF